MSRFELWRCVPSPDEELLCPICKDILDCPKETICGHVFCNFCITKALAKKQACPVDRNPCTKDDLKMVARPLQSMINKLELKCTHFQDGCDDLIQLDQFLDHYKVCKFEKESCKWCGGDFQRRALDEHQNLKCTLRQFPCEHRCGCEVTWINKDSHSCTEYMAKRINDLEVTNGSLKETAIRLQSDASVQKATIESLVEKVNILELNFSNVHTNNIFLISKAGHLESTVSALLAANESLQKKVSALESTKSDDETDDSADTWLPPQLENWGAVEVDGGCVRGSWDPDNNGIIVPKEQFDLVTKYDTNKDKCLTIEEYIPGFTTDFKVSKEFVVVDYGFWKNFVCPFDLAAAQAYFPDFTYEKAELGFIEIFKNMCEAKPSLWATNCDCLQLRKACLKGQEFSDFKTCNKLLKKDLDILG